MKKNGILQWDINELSNSLKISTDAVQEYFTDGRRVSFLIERRIALEVLKAKLAPSEGAGYDLVTSDGLKWEVRSLTKEVYFCPSYMIGSGRSFNETGFIEKINEIEGYIISDIKAFPNIPYWIIHKDIVLKWYRDNKLGSATKTRREKILKLFEEI